MHANQHQLTNPVLQTLHIAHRYSKQRSPYLFIALLSFVLYFAGLETFTELKAATDQEHITIEIYALLRGWFSMAIFLFLIRLSDDICDIPIDKITHPNRLLCSDKVDLKSLNYFRAALASVVITLQLPNITSALFIVAALLFFYLFFLAKPKLPTLIHVAILNFSLFVFPVYGGLLNNHRIGQHQLFMGLFFWIGGLAHDLSHSLLDTSNMDPSTLNPINRLNQTVLAWSALILFFISASFGAYLYFQAHVGVVFAALLALMMLAVIYLQVQLIKRPSEKTASPFYIVGFAFFLVHWGISSI